VNTRGSGVLLDTVGDFQSTGVRMVDMQLSSHGVCRKETYSGRKSTFESLIHQSMYMTDLSNSLQNKRNRLNVVDSYQSGVDVVHPNGLDLPCTITRSFQNRPHLLHAREQVPACQEPPDALGARRSGQAALVSPELVESTCVVECQLQIQFQRLLHRRCLVPVDHRRRELLHEC